MPSGSVIDDTRERRVGTSILRIRARARSTDAPDGSLVFQLFIIAAGVRVAVTTIWFIRSSQKVPSLSCACADGASIANASASEAQAGRIWRHSARSVGLRNFEQPLDFGAPTSKNTPISLPSCICE